MEVTKSVKQESRHFSDERFNVVSVLSVMICMSAAIISKRSEIKFIDVQKRKDD